MNTLAKLPERKVEYVAQNAREAILRWMRQKCSKQEANAAKKAQLSN